MTSQNFKIFSEDLREFERGIQPDIENGKKINIFCSFNYITPNYFILFVLRELEKFTRSHNFQIFVVLWDMNMLSNPYFKRLFSSGKVDDAKEYSNQKMNEVRDIMLSMGFVKENIHLYKSSDLWKRMVAFKENDLFYQFYGTLAQMPVSKFVANNRISHLIQMPIDLFFCNYFHKLYPEDVNKSMDLIIMAANKEDLYKATRELMVQEGFINNKKPLFVRLQELPYIVYNSTTPEWNMALKDMRELLFRSEVSKKEVLQVINYLFEDDEESKEEFNKKYSNAPHDKLIYAFSESLFSYLAEAKKEYEKVCGKTNEEIINLLDKNSMKKIGKVLRSKIALDILLLADGTKNTSQIAKELKKSIATISMYLSNLKANGLVRVINDGKIRRNIKGVKINFEFNIED